MTRQSDAAEEDRAPSTSAAIADTVDITNSSAKPSSTAPDMNAAGVSGQEMLQETEGILMANRHFAKLADVWKHLPLAEILSIERPHRYWESHAGNAAYSMVDDAERRYGALRFVEVATAFPALARSRDLAHLRSMNPAPGSLTAS